MALLSPSHPAHALCNNKNTYTHTHRFVTLFTFHRRCELCAPLTTPRLLPVAPSNRHHRQPQHHHHHHNNINNTQPHRHHHNHNHSHINSIEPCVAAQRLLLSSNTRRPTLRRRRWCHHHQRHRHRYRHRQRWQRFRDNNSNNNRHGQPSRSPHPAAQLTSCRSTWPLDLSCGGAPSPPGIILLAPHVIAWWWWWW